MNFEEYKQIQISGSDWSYNSKWGNQMEEAIIWFSSQIQDKTAKILDIGCGEGRGLDALKRHGFENVCGIDISDEKLNRARKNGHNVYNSDFHILKEVKNKEYDYIFCSHTLEHAYDLRLAVKTFLRVCKNQLLIIVPIKESKDIVEKINPSHTSPINDGTEITDILNELNLNYDTSYKKRLCEEMWITINL